MRGEAGPALLSISASQILSTRRPSTTLLGRLLHLTASISARTMGGSSDVSSTLKPTTSFVSDVEKTQDAHPAYRPGLTMIEEDENVGYKEYREGLELELTPSEVSKGPLVKENGSAAGLTDALRNSRTERSVGRSTSSSCPSSW